VKNRRAVCNIIAQPFQSLPVFFAMELNFGLAQQAVCCFVAAIPLLVRAVFAVQEILIPESGVFERVNLDRIGKDVVVFCTLNSMNDQMSTGASTTRAASVTVEMILIG